MKKVLCCCITLLSLSVAQAQNVGIGTQTPVSKLEVHNGALTISNTLESATLVIHKANALTNASSQILFQNNGASKWAVGGSNIGTAGADDFSIYNYNGGFNSFTILSSNNNVGIGTFTPGSALEVAGQITITGGSPGAGKVLTSNDIGLATWQPPNETAQHIIGENYGGGVVFYVTPNGFHGLIAETQDQGSYYWINAQNIISSSANHSTAGKNYTDWRLPTIVELDLLFTQRMVVGNFANQNYWSSTEGANADDGVCMHFNGGDINGFPKNTILFIRAVRSF